MNIYSYTETYFDPQKFDEEKIEFPAFFELPANINSFFRAGHIIAQATFNNPHSKIAAQDVMFLMIKVLIPEHRYHKNLLLMDEGRTPEDAARLLDKAYQHFSSQTPLTRKEFLECCTLMPLLNRSSEFIDSVRMHFLIDSKTKKSTRTPKL